jgi:hypothetical protein
MKLVHCKKQHKNNNKGTTKINKINVSRRVEMARTSDKVIEKTVLTLVTGKRRSDVDDDEIRYNNL